MGWTDLGLYIPTLEAQIVNQVYGNADYIKQQAEQSVTVRSLTAPNASYNTQIADVGTVLQTVENDIAILNEDVAESIYFEATETIGRWFRLENYQRWINILLDLLPIAKKEKGVWGQAYSTVETNTPDFQIDGKDVYIRGAKIG